MKVLVPLVAFESTYAGWAKFTKRLLEYLGEHQFEVLTFRSELKDSKFTFHPIPFDSVRNYKVRVLIFSIYAFFFILFNRKKYDVVFLPNMYLYSLFIAFSGHFGVNVIGRVCANELHSFRSKGSWLRRGLIGAIDTLVVLSKDSKDHALRLFGNRFKVRYLPNPVDAFFLNGERGLNESTILFVGEVNPRKGLERLIRSCTEARRDFPEIQLKLVGPVTDQAHFEYLNDTLKMTTTDWIIYLGKLDKQRLLDAYKSTTIFVLPSYSEGMPNVLLEAMSLGIPCIGSRISGITDNIEHGKNGLLLEEDDFSDLIKKLLSIPSYRKELGDRARKFILDHRTPEVCFSQYHDILFAHSRSIKEQSSE